MDASAGDHDQRWRHRRDQIPMLARTANQKRNYAISIPSRNSATAQHPLEPEPAEPPKLAWEKDILAAFRRDVRLRGLVGENATAQLLYLAISSRVLAKPVSVGVKGHSSSGKSHTVDGCLVLPRRGRDPVHLDERARARLPRGRLPASHPGHLQVTGLQETNEENLAAYFVRSLLSEGRIEYDVTIRGEGGQYTTQRITKEGPTNSSSRPRKREFTPRTRPGCCH